MTCEGYGCCFVADPLGEGKEPECYAKPPFEYPEWVAMPYGDCSAHCSDPQDSAVPTRNRELRCALTNGRAAEVATCAAERPGVVATCNDDLACATCSFLPVGSTCGHGRCERMYAMGDPSGERLPIVEHCACLDGYNKSSATAACTIDMSLSCTAERKLWLTSGWSECVGVDGAGGAQHRDVTCDCYGTCDAATKPDASQPCEVPAAPAAAAAAAAGLPSGWAKANVPVVDPTNHYVMLDFKSTSASYPAYTTSLASCLAACRDGAACPGVTWEGTASKGECAQINAFQLQWSPLQRSGNGHIFLRRNFLAAHPSEPLAKAVADAATDAAAAAVAAGAAVIAAADGAGAAWSPALSEAVLAANEMLSQDMSRLNGSDALWGWISSASSSSQGVPLRKSLYATGLPLAPNVLQHLRYLRTFLGSQHEIAGSSFSDVLLATAYMYRHLPSVLNSTGSPASAERGASVAHEKCLYGGRLNEDGSTRFPLYRDDNPSPLGALAYLLRHEANGALALVT